MNMFDTIKAHLATAVPFAGLAGVELTELGPGRATARLVQRPDLCNHLGTFHAGALFTLGETASGGAMTGAFAEQILSVRPVAAEARITYAKAARGTLTATATATEAPELLKARLDAEGKVLFDVTVDIADEQGQLVAGMTVAWHVRKT
ncbi:PaaI family thioesterase [Desertibaculum subflavum]|uniref:PaaI family thioesterase n=1 Tax=Desertibaculum subflavum TaxID=2268458 RepID=UPI000E666AA8